MEGKITYATAKVTLEPQFKKGDKVEIHSVLYDRDTVILRGKKRKNEKDLSAEWDEVVAPKGSFKGYYIKTSKGEFPELYKPLSEYFELIK